MGAQNQSGMSLIEVLIALVIFSVVALGAVGTVAMGMKKSNQVLLRNQAAVSLDSIYEAMSLSRGVWLGKAKGFVLLLNRKQGVLSVTEVIDGKESDILLADLKKKCREGVACPKDEMAYMNVAEVFKESFVNSGDITLKLEAGDSADGRLYYDVGFLWKEARDLSGARRAAALGERNLSDKVKIYVTKVFL